MHGFLLGAHNIVRWVVLITGAIALVRVWRGWMQRGVWGPQHLQAGKLFVWSITLQFIIGVAVYAVSPLIRQGMSDMGTAMRTRDIRYFLVEHVMMMLLSIALAHIGLARVKRASSDSARFQTATIWWGIAIAMAAGFVPWFRPLFPSF